MQKEAMFHVPVMLENVLEWLTWNDDGKACVLVDGTQGAGGHSYAFLEKYPQLVVWGVERDAAMQKVAKERLESFADRLKYNLTWFDDFFINLKQEGEVSAVLLDLGISTLHYTESFKGFSFQKDEPLDMRLDSVQPVSAADIVNREGEEELAEIFWTLSGERYAKEIARVICHRRKEQLFSSALDLAIVVEKAVPYAYRMGRIHPATRVFQALRITVNHELERLERVLPASVKALKPGGRLAVISFHSLEDRLVKNMFRKFEQDSLVRVLTKKPIFPSEAEIQTNPPSRSAKLRVLEKR